VHVISSAVQVRLTLNGRDLGPARQSDRFSFTFDAVAYEAGESNRVWAEYGSYLAELRREALTG
jgi:hypothetical protein